MRTQVEIVSHGGPSGVVHYREGPNVHAFPWEFGAGTTLLIIYVPAAADWDAALPWAAGRRATVLERVGRAAARREFPFGRVELAERWISVLAPRPPWRVVGDWLKRLVGRGPRPREG